jgi:hypothetical protein
LPNGYKSETMAWFEVMYTSALKWFQGEWQGIKIDVSSSYISASNCHVAWREVFLGAVVTGAAGAIRGAFFAGAAGTVLPGIGTVGGGVAGAVFGFAAGFTGAVATGVVTSLLATCTRNTRILVQPFNCNGNFSQFIQGRNCAQELSDKKIIYRIFG